MSSSPSPTSPAIPPSSSSADSPPPPSSLSPPPIFNSPPPFSSPPVPSAPSPTPPPPSSPPPAFSPPSSPTSPPVTPPPPDLSSPPVTPPPPDLTSPPVTPPPPDLSSPPVTPPPPDLTSPLPSSPPAASTPPPSSPPAASPPPPPTPAVSPPPITPPPPPIEAQPTPTLTPPPSPPPPSPNASAPPPPDRTSSPTPNAASPPPPDRTSSPTPNAASPPPPSVPSSPQIPIASPPPPHLPGKPTGTSPPPPAADSPKSSPSPPPQEMSRSPPSVPSAPPPKSTLPPPRTTPPPPANSSGGATTPSPVQAPSTILPNNSANPISANNSSNSFAPASGVPGNSTSGGGTTNTAAAVSIGLAAVFVLLCSLGLAVWFVRRRRKSVAGYAAGFVMPSPLTSSIMSESPHPRSPTAPLIYHHHHHKSGSVGSEAGIVSAQSPFSYDELFAITNGFSPQNILGEGGFGCVYKGCLPDGREVAVKQLKVGSGQGEREFKAEVEIISRVHHRHLVSLVGYCISENQRLLVYDFVPNGTLDSHIHGKGKAVLDWPTRVKVAAGAARGIAYLHEDCHPRIIHRDIKSSNILLDNNFEAQVSDFGLARLAMDCKTHVTTRVIGTFGYLAPEYASSGKLTDRSDVYSFGVVLLELITGRKPVDDSQPMGDESLVEWARPRLTHALETKDFGELPDSRLEKNYNEMEMLRMVEAAAACIRHSAPVRPQMGKVVRILDALADADLTNGVNPRQSEVSDGRELSELRLLQRLAFGSQVFAPEHSHSSWSGQSDI